MMLHKPSAFVAMLALLAPGTALATCPNGMTDLNCNAGGANAICDFSTMPLTCDLGANGETSTTWMYMTSTSSTSVQAWGVAGNGGAFCCEESGLADACSGTRHTATIYGTVENDTISLQWSTSDNLNCTNAQVWADEGNDHLIGSRSSNSGDALEGEEDDDLILGAGGDDVLHGGPGVDELYGQDGDDTLRGNLGDDRLEGGPGNDALYGEGDADVLCGQGDDDYLSGGGGNDSLYAGTESGDQNYGGGDTDTCGDSSVYNDATCEDDFLTACPPI